ncbi:hypothetical protein EMPG_10835, partial [Blastomyces silverae]
SSVCSFSFIIHSSSAQKTVKLSLQSFIVSLLSSYEETLIQSLISTATYLYCAKQLKEREILYTHSVIYIHCFHCI